jgi:hypothetical protein
LLGQVSDSIGDRIAHGLGAVAGRRWTVLDPYSTAVALMGGRCSSSVKRVERSTNVPIAELLRPG